MVSCLIYSINSYCFRSSIIIQILSNISFRNRFTKHSCSNNNFRSRFIHITSCCTSIMGYIISCFISCCHRFKHRCCSMVICTTFSSNISCCYSSSFICCYSQNSRCCSINCCCPRQLYITSCSSSFMGYQLSCFISS
jgi:hypothetical protein